MLTGIHNLLVKCAAVTAGERVLVVQENPALGWYDQSVMTAVTEGLTEIGADQTVVSVQGPDNDVDPSLATQINTHDCTIYLARIGDQDRFGQLPPGTRSVMCYVRDQQMLDSTFCTTDYRAFKALKHAVDQVFAGAARVRISCALGTELTGEMPNGKHQGQQDVSVLRFPLGVPTPVLAETFSGQVALTHYLTPTGNRVYDPPSLRLSDTAIARVDHGAISGFTGNAQSVAQIKSHYASVAARFDIDSTFVHSWHAGIHPGCAYTAAAADNPDRWSNTVFCNPHFVHFHTCGNYPPGEICWMVRDPTIHIDDVALWENGQLMLERFEATRACVDQWPELDPLSKSGPVPLGL